MGRVTTIGMSNTDLVCRAPRLPAPGETVAGQSLEIFAGGKGANQAVAAARAGADVTFGGAVGDDAYGSDRIEDLLRSGVDVSAVQMFPGVSSGIAIIIVDQTGENQIVTAAGANGLVDASLILRQIVDRPPDVVLMTWEWKAETSRAILDGLDPDIQILLNVAPYDNSIRESLPDRRLILVCNRAEAEQLIGRPVSNDEGMVIAREIQSLGCRAAIVTLGGFGAAGADENGSWSVTAPTVDVVDTTGAGDAFCGAFAAWLADGSTLQEATRAGVAAGSCAVSTLGAQPSLPTSDAIASVMRTIDC